MTLENTTDPSCYKCGAPCFSEGYPCPECRAKQVKKWRKEMTLQPTRQFPGVDIDAIHRNPRWMKIKAAA